jgi:hypothetical protein
VSEVVSPRRWYWMRIRGGHVIRLVGKPVRSTEVLIDRHSQVGVEPSSWQVDALPPPLRMVWKQQTGAWRNLINELGSNMEALEILGRDLGVRFPARRPVISL